MGRGEQLECLTLVTNLKANCGCQGHGVKYRKPVQNLQLPSYHHACGILYPSTCNSICSTKWSDDGEYKRVKGSGPFSPPCSTSQTELQVVGKL